jgi:NADH-quinone oxidoreductase subunit J
MSPALLVLLLTLGGVGLYLVMPGGHKSVLRAGLLLLAGGAVALVAALLPLAGEAAGPVFFFSLALLGLWAAIRVVTHSRPVYSALYFVLVALTVAGLLVLMQAEFLAAALVIIYAGAILVTYVFVIMLAQQAGGPARYDATAREPLLGCLTGFVLLALLAARMMHGAPAADAAAASAAAVAGTVSHVGTALLTKYAIGVQLAGALLLASMVGAIAVARRKALDAPVGEEGE